MPPANIYGRFHLSSRHLNPELFGQLDVFRNKMARADERCREIAKGEQLMGYEDSWRAYTDLANELKELYQWLYQKLI